MTREEAKHWLEIELKTWEDECKSKHPIKEALNVAIKALEQEPSYNSVDSLVESKLKNPRVKTFDILHFVADNAGLSTFEAIEKAYNMGVSEQEQVLDKIRSEIEQRQQFFDVSIYYIDAAREQELSWVLELIDKYTSESEENV